MERLTDVQRVELKFAIRRAEEAHRDLQAAYSELHSAVEGIQGEMEDSAATAKAQAEEAGVKNPDTSAFEAVRAEYWYFSRVKDLTIDDEFIQDAKDLSREWSGPFSNLEGPPFLWTELRKACEKELKEGRTVKGKTFEEVLDLSMTEEG